MILAEIAKDVEPGFDHQFYWNIGSKHLARAKKIWSKTNIRNVVGTIVWSILRCSEQ